MTKSPLLALALPLALSACAIHQNVKPVGQVAAREICVVINPKVFNEGFVQSYEKALRRKGFTVQELPQDAALNSCPLVTTYTANWYWDMAMYMNYAEIRIYDNTKPIGEAIYDSRHGSANLAKFIKAENKINELVDQLFPGGPAAAAPDALRTGAAPQ